MNLNVLNKFTAHKPIRDEVFLSLRKAILNGHFEPGERLIEEELAEQMGISRTPVREALRKLEIEGLVAYVPRKGVLIIGVSTKDALEIYTIRAVLEGLAARLAANTITKEELIELKKNLTEMEVCIKKNNINKYIVLQSRFHDSFVKASKSQRLYHMIASLRDYVKKFAKISYSLQGRLQKGWEEHKQIVDAISKGDGDLAERMARNHILQAKESFLKVTYNKKEGK